MKNHRIKLMCFTGLFTALVFVVTAYLHIPTYNGYVHVGDGLIYIASCLLPWPYAMFVGAGGALLADCLTGYAIWAPGSVIIKGITVLVFSNKGKKINTRRNLWALLPAAIICAGGYYLYESLITGSFIASLEGIPSSITQSVASSVIFVILGLAIDKIGFKQKLVGGKQL